MKNKINDSNINDSDINLGGYPPIIYINLQQKKQREFKKLNNKINISSVKNLNILNIKNILNDIKN